MDVKTSAMNAIMERIKPITPLLVRKIYRNTKLTYRILGAGHLLKSHFLIGDLGAAMVTTPFYLSLIAVIIYCCPSLTGLEASDLDRLLGTIRRWMFSFGPKA
jgi:hypothetical protein